jgi:hypothetical protein
MSSISKYVNDELDGVVFTEAIFAIGYGTDRAFESLRCFKTKMERVTYSENILIYLNSEISRLKDIFGEALLFEPAYNYVHECEDMVRLYKYYLEHVKN